MTLTHSVAAAHHEMRREAVLTLIKKVEQNQPCTASHMHSSAPNMLRICVLGLYIQYISIGPRFYKDTTRFEFFLYFSRYRATRTPTLRPQRYRRPRMTQTCDLCPVFSCSAVCLGTGLPPLARRRAGVPKFGLAVALLLLIK